MYVSLSSAHLGQIYTHSPKMQCDVHFVRYNLHVVKCILSVQLNNESVCPCNPHHCQDIKHIYYLRKFLCTPSWSISFLSLYPKATTILVSININ